MLSLIEDLQKPKYTNEEFTKITLRVLEYLPNVLSEEKIKSGYKIHSSSIAGTLKFIRPINRRLFIYSPIDFNNKLVEFEMLFEKLKVQNNQWEVSEKELLESVLYTIQQSIGVGFDLLANPNSARKHVGNRFEELIKAIFTEMGIANKKTVLQIPYQTDEE